MGKPTLIDLNPIELNYYLFMISLDKCNENCNAVDYLFMKMCVPSKTKDVNINVFNVITRIHEAETSEKHISCHCKCKFFSTTCGSNQKWNNNTCQRVCKRYCACKKNIFGILAHVLLRMVSI